MSEDQDTQPVVHTADAPATPVAEVAVDARNDGDDLDALLKDYDEHDKTTAAAATPTKPEPGAAPDINSLAQKVENIDGFVREANALRYRQDMDKTVDKVRGDLDPEIFDGDLVESYLDAQAKKDPRLAQAWVNRHADPKKFDRIVSELGKSFAKKFSKMPDRQATDDRAAVAAAVRGASTRAPEGKAPNYAALSDNDFQAEKDKAFGN